MHHIHTQLGIIAIAALLTLSVITVTVAPRSAAAPSVPDFYTITIGKSETWGGQQFNYHEAGGTVWPGHGTHAESAELKKLATSIAWTASSDIFQTSYALIGVTVRLPGTYTQDEWAKIANTPITLKTTVPYSLSAGADGRAVIGFAGTAAAPYYTTLKEVKSGSASGVARGEMTGYLHNIVSNYGQAPGVYEGHIYVSITSKPQYSVGGTTSPYGSASASAVVANIQLTWPDGTTAS